MANLRRTFWPSSCSYKYSANTQNRYRIAANYNTSIFQGDLVAMVTGGGIERVAAGGSGLILGVLTDVNILIQLQESQHFQTTILQAQMHLISWLT